MFNGNNRDKNIYEEIKACVQELGLPIIGEDASGDILIVYVAIEENSFSIRIQAAYFSMKALLKVIVEISHVVQNDKLQKTYELCNLINIELSDIGTFCIRPNIDVVTNHTVIFISEKGLNKNQLKKSLIRIIWQCFHLYGLIVTANYTNMSPEKIMNDYIRNIKKILERKDEMINKGNPRRVI